MSEDVLSQEEVESLLSAMAGNEISDEEVPEASPESDSESDSSSEDWAAVGFLPRGDLRVDFFFFLDGWERSSPSKL